ncbi:MAG: hypothetical protein GXP32_05580 [Kiritimatiellaeota bacterium]|nr:hypothetical protein [Kiritimatiellota bacterium]
MLVDKKMLLALMLPVLAFCAWNSSAERIEQIQPASIDENTLRNTEKTASDMKRTAYENAERFFNNAKRLAAENKFEEAEIELGKAREIFNANKEGNSFQLRLKQLDAYNEKFIIKWEKNLMNTAYDAFADKNYDKAIIFSTEAQSINGISDARKQKIEDFKELCQKRIDSNEFKKITALTYKDVDPDNEIRNNEIHVAMRNAEILMRNKQYTKARDAFEKILVRDPYNFDATNQLRKIYKKLEEVAILRKQNDVLERVSEVMWKWSEAVLPVPAKRPQKEVAEEDDSTGSLTRKLDSLIVKQIAFTDAGIQSVVRFLGQESKRLDAAGTGINIALGVNDKELAQIRKITMNLENIPMSAVIRYLCQITGLKYRIQGRVLTIGTASIDEMDTRFFKVRSALIARIAPKPEGDDSENTDLTGDDVEFNTEDTLKKDDSDSGSTKKNLTSEMLETYFKQRGIPFPENSTIAYSKRSGKLTVKNTTDNLRRLDMLLRDLDIEQPQVLIEAKFLEVNQVDLEEFGFEWWMSKTPAAANTSSWTINANDSLVRPLWQSKDGVASPVNSNASAAGRIFNNLNLPGFGQGDEFTLTMILHALDRNSTTEVLSAPKVIAKSGNEATIRMVREMYFPESWSDPELVVVNSVVQYTPPLPDFGDATDVGIRFTVTPTVKPDNHTISLDLNPQVLQFLRFSNYSINYRFGGNTGTSLVTMPEISRRDVITKVKVYDGDTLVLGGMLTEDARSADDSFPGSDKAPLLGALGRMQTSSKDKRNLLIFVTARIVNPDGLPIRISPQNGLFDFRR